MRWLYLTLDVLALLGPLALSFDRRVAFFRKLPQVVRAIAAMMLVFVPLDMVFTYRGIWGFDSRYTLGVYLGNLPLEEWLFFPSVTYACLFIYECLRVYVHRTWLERYARTVLLILAACGLLLALVHAHRQYTLVKVGAASLGLLLVLYWQRPEYLPRFLLMYLVSNIPFVAMNGIMTGTLIEGEIVWYNSRDIVGWRIGTIPIEDFYYSLAMLLLATVVYERGERHLGKSSPKQGPNQKIKE